MLSRVLTALPLVLALAAPAAAQEAATGWSVGAFGLTNSNIYRGADDRVLILPDVTFRTDRLSVGARGLSYTAFESGPGALDLIVAPRLAPYDSSDSAFLSGMERDLTVDAGLAYSLEFDTGTTMRARFLQEITGEHDGQQIDFEVQQSLLNLGLPFGVVAGARWESADLASFLYGVRATEATGARPAYAPGDTIVPYIGLGTRIPLSDRFAVFGGVRGEFYSDEVTNSPIVEDDMAITATIGLSFQF